ncbi:hypothetical protein FLX56_21665 [Synechococcus moorigangaii CMS01]|nr:hypothetical protein [Synechococcus moorigangaii CMS01]
MLSFVQSYCCAPVFARPQAPSRFAVLGIIGFFCTTAPMAIAQVPPQLICDYADAPREPATTPAMSCMLRFDAIEINGLEPLSSGQPPSRYSWFMRQAEDRTRLLIPSLFRQSPTPTTLDLLVLGQNDVAVAPLFNLRLTQQDWQSSPNIKQWANYYPEAAILLNMEPPITEPEPDEPAAPEANPAPAPPSSTPGSLTPPPTLEMLPGLEMPPPTTP